MQRVIVVCDVCRKDGAERLGIDVGGEELKEVDLCPDCTRAQLVVFIEALPVAGRTTLVRSLVVAGKLMGREQLFRGM